MTIILFFVGWYVLSVAGGYVFKTIIERAKRNEGSEP